MIRRYLPSETIWEHNKYVLKPINATVTEEANGMFELEIELPKGTELNKRDIITAPTPRGEQPFRVYRIVKTLYGIRVNAKHIFYDLADSLLLDARPTNQNGQGALHTLITASGLSGWTYFSDITKTGTAYYIRKNPVEAIMGADNCLLKVWGGNLLRNKKDIRVIANGVDRGYEIRLGKNLVGIEDDSDDSAVVTRLYPTYEKDNVIFDLPEKYIDSPLIGNYNSPIVREERVSLTDAEKELPLAEIHALIRTYCQNLFTHDGVDKPVINYKIDFVELSKYRSNEFIQLEKIDLYDIVTVDVAELGIKLKARVIKYTYDAVGEKYLGIELGGFKPSNKYSTDNIIKQIEIDKENASDEFRELFNFVIDRVTGNKGGYQVTRVNANGEPYETLWMDTPKMSTAKNVLRINKEGIAGSVNGINGPYATAITTDGWIVAERIMAYSLDAISANLGTITAGRIQDADNESYWDLNSKEIKLNVSELKVNSKNVVQEDTYNNEKPTYGSTAPTSPVLGKLWVDTSVTPNLLKRWNGTKWVIINDTSALVTRVQEAEQKILPNAIINTVRDATNQDNEPLFAKTAETKLMADNWTARFSYIGGKNLIKNSEELDFSPWEGSNVTVTRGVSVPEWGTENGIRVLATAGNGTTTLKAYSSLYTNHNEMRGKTYTLSCYVKNNRTDATATIHSLRFGSVTLQRGEQKRIVITGTSTADASAHLQIHAEWASSYADVTIWHPQLELGEVVTDWRPHSDELYAGYTRIDQDGVTVGKDFGETETSLVSNGVIVKTKSGETLLEIDPRRSYIPNVYADNVYAQNAVTKIGRFGGLVQRGVWLDNIARGDGSGRDMNNTSDNLKEALDYATEGGSVLNNAVVSVNVLGVKHVGNWEIKGYTGNGSIEIYFYPGSTLNGSIDIIDNSCRIIVRSAELGNGKIIRSSARDTIFIRNSSAVELNRIAVIHPSTSDYPLNVENSRAFVFRCDLSGNSTTYPSAAANIALNSQTYFDNCSGNTTDAVYRYTTGSSAVSYQYRPKASNTTEPFTGSLGHAKAVSDIPIDSRVTVPAISWVPTTKTFTARLYRITQSSGYRTNGSFVQGTSPNNRSQAYRGYASWGSTIYDWLRANGGYQNISSIKLYATRGGFGYGDSDLIFTNPAERTIPAIPRYGTKFSELKGYTLGNLVENSTDLTINTTTLSTTNYADFTKIWVSITVSKRA